MLDQRCDHRRGCQRHLYDTLWSGWQTSRDTRRIPVMHCHAGEEIKTKKRSLAQGATLSKSLVQVAGKCLKTREKTEFQTSLNWRAKANWNDLLLFWRIFSRRRIWKRGEQARRRVERDRKFCLHSYDSAGNRPGLCLDSTWPLLDTDDCHPSKFCQRGNR